MVKVKVTLVLVIIQGFPRGSTRRFLLSTMANLGPLSFCRVWHDNSGKGVDSGWFLDKVIIEDLQTRIRYACRLYVRISRLFSASHNYKDIQDIQVKDVTPSNHP